MTTLRDLMGRARRHMDAARAPYADRPTSLYAAGSVGDQLRAVVRREPDEAIDVAQPRLREFEAPRMETNHVEDRPRRSAGPVSRRQAGRHDLLQATLRSPAALRRAMIVHEVLRPPVALRDDRR
jgi:hypothetical protein